MNQSPNCSKCKTKMIKGSALQNTVVGYPDFIGDSTHCTISQTGPPEIVPCWKCPKCGRSIVYFKLEKPDSDDNSDDNSEWQTRSHN